MKALKFASGLPLIEAERDEHSLDTALERLRERLQRRRERFYHRKPTAADKRRSQRILGERDDG